jgi:hypothetical protein
MRTPRLVTINDSSLSRRQGEGRFKYSLRILESVFVLISRTIQIVIITGGAERSLPNTAGIFLLKRMKLWYKGISNPTTKFSLQPF